jgi:prepilin-type N-terminal cleavage/methylation domain-containing protein
MQVLARVRRRLAAERGFTLIELMVAASVGVVIIGVAFGLLDSAVRTVDKSGNRIDVSQRGRLALDEITQRLRSQVCGGPSTAYIPSIVSGAPNRVVFYSDMGDSSGRQLRALDYSGGQIRWFTYPGTDPTAAPTSTQVLATDVAPNNGTGMFKYFSYNPQAADQTITPAPALYLTLPDTLAATDLEHVVRITVGFTAYDHGGTATDSDASDFNGDFLSRNASSPYEFSTVPTDLRVLEPRCK